MHSLDVKLGSQVAKNQEIRAEHRTQVERHSLEGHRTQGGLHSLEGHRNQGGLHSLEEHRNQGGLHSLEEHRNQGGLLGAFRNQVECHSLEGHHNDLRGLRHENGRGAARHDHEQLQLH
jgi:hypothetical protein